VDLLYFLGGSFVVSIAAITYISLKNTLKEKLSKIEFLETKIKEIELDKEKIETSYSSNISSLQESFKIEQEIIQERKNELDEKEKDILSKFKNLEEKLLEEQEAKKKVVHQKKSSEVRLGHIAETLAPFLDQFDFEPEECSFLGQPIDYISFGNENITFIEVKSGNSQLSSKQRKIRDQIENGKIKWKEVRIK